MRSNLSNARHPNEPFDVYQQRRRDVNKAIRRYLRGTLAHVSSQIVSVGVPPLPADEKAIERGLIRDLTPPRVDNAGKLYRLGRQRGTTFRYVRGRAAHREKVLAERRAR